jgi:nucleoid-associated protein YgaU
MDRGRRVGCAATSARGTPSRLAALATAVIVGRGLVWCTPTPLKTDPVHALAAVGAADPASAVTVVVAAVAWVTAGRIALGALLLLAARLPGASGRRFRRCARIVTPRLVRRTLEGLLGAALVASGPLSGAAMAAGSGVAPPVPPVPVPSPLVAPPPPALHVSLDRPVAPLWSARPPSLDRALGGDGHGLDRLPPPATNVVVVRAGDTLWDIARRHLPAGATPTAVARAWPRWYAANRAVIGPDPDLVRPGQRLVAPLTPRKDAP